jgi:hypothetical protein
MGLLRGLSGLLGGVLGLVSGLLRGVLALVLSLVGVLLLIVAAVLCVTVILLPLGIPLGALALRLLSQAFQLLLPGSTGAERFLARSENLFTKRGKRLRKRLRAVR